MFRLPNRNCLQVRLTTASLHRICLYLLRRNTHPTFQKIYICGIEKDTAYVVTENGTYDIEEFAEVVVNVPSSGPQPTEDQMNVRSLSYYNYGGCADFILEHWGDQMTFTDPNGTSYCCYGAKVCPPEIKDSPLSQYFFYTYKGHDCPRLTGQNYNTLAANVAYVFSKTQIIDMYNLFDDNYNFGRLHNTSVAFDNWFNSNYWLRRLPKLINQVYSSRTTNQKYPYYNGFQDNYTLDNYENMPVDGNDGRLMNSNMFFSTFINSFKCKKITFATNNGTPYSANWSNQAIQIGYGYYIGYSSKDLTQQYGIPAGKEVTDAASYQALKNDPDWWTRILEYSRYNHDSAVETINSLPNCSTGSSNTITFKGSSGTNTDGGAISNLTAAEIAVATAKGWTVTIA